MIIRPLKICSTVFRPGLKPACSSASSSSTLVLGEDNSKHDLAGMAD